MLTDEKTKQTLGQLFDFSNSLGQIDFGSGKSIGTFSLSLPWHDSLVKIFFISYRPQFTWFPFREMVEHGIDKELILGFIRKFQSVGFEFNEKSVELAPTFDVSILNDKERFENFNCRVLMAITTSSKRNYQQALDQTVDGAFNLASAGRDSGEAVGHPPGPGRRGNVGAENDLVSHGHVFF